MNSKDLNNIIDERIQKTKDTLQSKAVEYASDEDRLANFVKGARITGDSKERVLKGYMLKHIISIFDIIDNIDKGLLPSIELLNEKISDNICYLILLEASVTERINNLNKARGE
jgi:hypothetical protein